MYGWPSFGVVRQQRIYWKDVENATSHKSLVLTVSQPARLLPRTHEPQWVELKSDTSIACPEIGIKAIYNISLSGVPDFFDRNKILSGYDLSHYQVPHCIKSFLFFCLICLYSSQFSILFWIMYLL